jgi:Co/Zn/Cd efflux system component
VDQPPARPPIALRHSLAALRGAESGQSQRSIAIALLANLVVAAAKLAAGLISGSVALLAEAGHSAADSVNELLLGLRDHSAARMIEAMNEEIFRGLDDRGEARHGAAG